MKFTKTRPQGSPNPDFASFEALLTEEQKMLMHAIRSFVRKEAEPVIAKAYIDEDFPRTLIPKIGELGILGANLDGYGLPGVDEVAYGLAMREFERCDSGLRSFVSVQGGLVMFPIHQFGSEEQKNEWLPKLHRAEAIGCFGLTESDGGSNPGAMKTRAEDKGDHWLLNGSKMWITNGNLAQIAIVWAQTDQGIRGFIVPTNSPGFTIRQMKNKLSLRASVTSELYFDNVKLPKTAILPKSEGLKSALACLTTARYGIAWGVLGAAEACFDEAMDYLKTRNVFGRPLTAYQLVQRKLAICLTRITTGQLLVHRLGQLKQEGKLHFSQVSMAKQNNCELALEVARICRDLLGGNGIMIEYKTMRHMCNLETVYTYEGTNDIHLLIVGAEITGIPAFGQTVG
jgi:glutaryl-CoA dehydrogenase